MTSFLRISDIPADELHLLPVLGLRKQIRKDRSRPSSPANAAPEREANGAALQGRARHAGAAPAEVPPAEPGQFVTDWQLHEEPRPSAPFRFDREGRDDVNHSAAAALAALYVELGGEG
jgi:hypothetical protein